MKKNKYIAIISSAFVLCTIQLNAQTVSTFSEIEIPVNSYWNGSDSTNTGGFNSGNAFFPNTYNQQFEYWESGFAISNKKDPTTADSISGFSKLYNAITPGGYLNTGNYAIAQSGVVINLTGAAAGKQVDGVYITNSNYAYQSMKWGDQFAKQFTDSDFFLLNVVGYKNGDVTDTAVGFYLAQGTNLVNTWLWLDLKPLGNIDSIEFYLESSDTGAFGMNTPAFFCMDNFTTSDISTGMNQIAAQLKGALVYPNPASGIVNIETATSTATAILSNMAGIPYIQSDLILGVNQLSVQGIQPGLYILTIESNGIVEKRKVHIHE